MFIHRSTGVIVVVRLSHEEPRAEPACSAQLSRHLYARSKGLDARIVVKGEHRAIGILVAAGCRREAGAEVVPPGEDETNTAVSTASPPPALSI